MKNKRKKLKKYYLRQNQNEWNQYRVMKIGKKIEWNTGFGKKLHKCKNIQKYERKNEKPDRISPSLSSMLIPTINE